MCVYIRVSLCACRRLYISSSLCVWVPKWSFTQKHANSSYTWMLPVATWPFSWSDWEWGRCMGEESGLSALPLPNVDMVSTSEDTARCMLLEGGGQRSGDRSAVEGRNERHAVICCSCFFLIGAHVPAICSQSYGTLWKAP